MKVEDLNKILAIGLQAMATYRTMRDQMKAAQPDAAGLVDDGQLLKLMEAEAAALEGHANAILAKHRPAK